MTEFVAALLGAVGETGLILVWNKTFEISRMRELAAMFPDHAPELYGFIERVVDLMKIYQRHYYHRDMRGSWSIKKVLPTIAPDLDYGTLEVGNGDVAQAAYRRAVAPETSGVERETIRRNLLDYCKRDTEAMVRLTTWHTAPNGQAMPVSDIRSRTTCSKCRGLCGFIHIATFAFAVNVMRASLKHDRIMRGSWVSICPTCDAYPLMIECIWGVPFYSEREKAVISIADYDSKDAIELLELGNLPFTPNALRGALEMLRAQTAQPDDGIERFDRSLLGPTGIPDDDSAPAEWFRQLELLTSKLPERLRLAELNAAMRVIVEQVPNLSE